MKTNSTLLTKIFFVLGIFSVATFVTYGSVTTSGLLLKSTPYQSRDTVADTTLSQLTNGKGAAILDGVIEKIAVRAKAKAGNPVNLVTYNAYIDERLKLIDMLDNEVRNELGSDYAFIFKYAYPRVYELKKQDKIASVMERFGNAMGGDDINTVQPPVFIPAITPVPVPTPTPAIIPVPTPNIPIEQLISLVAEKLEVIKGETLQFTYTTHFSQDHQGNQCKAWFSTNSENNGKEVVFSTPQGVTNTLSGDDLKNGSFSINFTEDAYTRFKDNRSQVQFRCNGMFNGTWQEVKKIVDMQLINPAAAIENHVPVTRDIAYKGINKLDVYMPATTIAGTKIPVYLTVHGGGWIGGTKGDIEYLASRFTKTGIAYVPIDYTMATESKESVSVVYKEIDCALKWVLANKDTYDFDVNNINLVGGSAGGHLVLQYALNQSSYNDAECIWSTEKPVINQLVSMYGPSDLSKDFSNTIAGDMNFVIEYLLGEKRSTSAFVKKVNENSPINFMNRDNKNIKYYLFHAKNDGIVNYDDHAVPLFHLMKSNGYKVVLDTLLDGHNDSTIPDTGFAAMFSQAKGN